LWLSFSHFTKRNILWFFSAYLLRFIFRIYLSLHSLVSLRRLT